jgi:hypothetical protein
VGAGFLTRTPGLSETLLERGVPVGLSCFSTNPVTVGFELRIAGQILESGSLVFLPGEMIKTLPPLPALPLGAKLARLQLTAVQHCEITGDEALWVVCSTSPVSTTLIPAGATWRYLDNGTPPAPGWTGSTVDDGGWKNGIAELGYGDGDEATTVSYGGNANDKFITTYFRHPFTVADPGAIAELLFEVKRDDGAVVHVNGVEVFRSNMPQGPVSNGTLAPLANDDGDLWWPMSVPASVLAPGANVVAVEIHQQSVTSSDISFDLRLTAATVPRIELVQFGDDWVVYWTNERFALESAPDLAGPWTLWETGSPATIDVLGARQFFRLRSP